MSNQTAADSLQEDQDVNGDANAVVRIRQTPRRADSHEAEDEEYGAQEHGEDVEVGMVPDAVAGPLCVETDIEDGKGHNEEECDGC